MAKSTLLLAVMVCAFSVVAYCPAPRPSIDPVETGSPPSKWRWWESNPRPKSNQDASTLETQWGGGSTLAAPTIGYYR